MPVLEQPDAASSYIQNSDGGNYFAIEATNTEVQGQFEGCLWNKSAPEYYGVSPSEYVTTPVPKQPDGTSNYIQDSSHLAHGGTTPMEHDTPSTSKRRLSTPIHEGMKVPKIDPIVKIHNPGESNSILFEREEANFAGSSLENNSVPGIHTDQIMVNSNAFPTSMLMNIISDIKHNLERGTNMVHLNSYIQYAFKAHKTAHPSPFSKAEYSSKVNTKEEIQNQPVTPSDISYREEKLSSQELSHNYMEEVQKMICYNDDVCDIYFEKIVTATIHKIQGHINSNFNKMKDDIVLKSLSSLHQYFALEIKDFDKKAKEASSIAISSLDEITEIVFNEIKRISYHPNREIFLRESMHFFAYNPTNNLNNIVKNASDQIKKVLVSHNKHKLKKITGEYLSKSKIWITKARKHMKISLNDCKKYVKVLISVLRKAQTSSEELVQERVGKVLEDLDVYFDSCFSSMPESIKSIISLLYNVPICMLNIARSAIVAILDQQLIYVHNSFILYQSRIFFVIPNFESNSEIEVRQESISVGNTFNKGIWNNSSTGSNKGTCVTGTNDTFSSCMLPKYLDGLMIEIDREITAYMCNLCSSFQVARCDIKGAVATCSKQIKTLSDATLSQIKENVEKQVKFIQRKAGSILTSS